MKKIILLAIGAALLCGCNKQTTDSAQIEALSQKVDLLLSEVDSLKSQVTNLPTAQYLDGMNFYYNTNLSSSIDDIDKGTHILVKDDKWLMDMDGLMSTNATILGDGNSLIIDRVDKILNTTANIEFSLTNWPPVTGKDINLIETESDVSQTKDDVDEIQEDLRKIKTRLGIPY